MTPVFPQHFLLLASVANIAKQISLSCYLATGVRFPCDYFVLYVWCVLCLTTKCFDILQSAVHRSFAVADNLGEVSAKAQVSFEKKPTQVFYCLYHIHDLILRRFKPCVLITLVSYWRFF